MEELKMEIRTFKELSNIDKIRVVDHVKSVLNINYDSIVLFSYLNKQNRNVGIHKVTNQITLRKYDNMELLKWITFSVSFS